MAGTIGLAGCGQRDATLTGENAEIALETLKGAPAHGFRAERFNVEQIEKLLASSDRKQKAEGERLLRAATLDYARAQHGLTIPASALPKNWGLKREKYDAEASLAAALKEGDLKEWLEEQPPASPNYQALQQAYATYLKIHANGGWPQIAPTSLQPGQQGPEVAALRQRLALEDKAFAETPDGGVDANLIGALQRFQTAHGLPATGQLDKLTLEQLNVPALARAAQIRANLERLRWLTREEVPTRIDVNIAAAVMDQFVDGKHVTHMLAVSGRPGGDETPMLASQIDNIVLNPPWNVPEGIAQEEVIPKGEAYLQSQGFIWKDGRLVQQPGPKAALGQVKFDFDNPYAVYLHDTPAKAAFNQSQRAVSHGCVRLAQAIPLARMILSSETGWSPQRVDEVLASGETTHVKLSKAIPVRLLYFTAFPEGNRMAFRTDVYGWDAQLLALLDRSWPAPKPAGTKT